MSASGIQESSSGDRVIPASRRPDGSIRKERKVRPGFVPQEDVSRYANAKVEQTRVPEGYVPGLGISKPKEESGTASKSAKKNAKRKAKKAGDQAESGNAVVETQPNTSGQPASLSTPSAPSQDPEKRLKVLRKKLRQVQELEVKLKDGEELLPEQNEKLASKPTLEKEIGDLEKALKTLSV